MDMIMHILACLGCRDPLGFQDRLLNSIVLGNHAFGTFSSAVVQANLKLEDRSQVEAGKQATFVGVYDGHGGSHTSKYIARRLFHHLTTLALQRREISGDLISRAIAETESGYLSYSILDNRQEALRAGSCCLVGVIWNRRLFVANLGDSRAVLGVSYGNNEILAQPITHDHNANVESVRIELIMRHGDPDIVVEKNGTWRVRDILQVTRAIGDFELKYENFSLSPEFQFPEPLPRPYITADPELHEIELDENCRFVIFASDGLWENMTNEEAVSIVHKTERDDIARRLVVKAMHNACTKTGTKYSRVKKFQKGQRRNYHDDITVVVVYIDQLDPAQDANPNPVRVPGIEPAFEF